jgi:hypothetical protein
VHRIIQKTLGALVTLALLTGCGSNSSDAGNEYIGKWEELSFSSIKLEIERAGKIFIVRQKSTSGPQVSSRAMTYKDGILLDTFGNVVNIDKASGNITYGFGVYKRVD